MALLTSDAVAVRHPLEPLSVDEIAAAVDILRRQRQLGPRVRFVNITLHEPPKDVVLAFETTGSAAREASAILFDNEQGRTYEAVISLTHKTVTSWAYVPGVQPAIMLDEFLECELACKASPDWQGATRTSGHTDLDRVRG